ncbi:UNVERIFIED_CONTAM: hypothetical protein Slati_2006700 [Sesamum latifolium]|uniref:LysM domain-containing protein n=1 Tax=Sesamum latifolium TaxID=2727402 RepID=A0AAW2WLY6_9LAMI
MAKISTNFLNFALMLSSLLLIVAIAESRTIFRVHINASPTLTCDSVVGVKSGDTCFAIAQTYNLTTTAFDAINPNLNCTALFVGQWLCINGS